MSYNLLSSMQQQADQSNNNIQQAKSQSLFSSLNSSTFNKANPPSLEKFASISINSTFSSNYNSHPLLQSSSNWVPIDSSQTTALQPPNSGSIGQNDLLSSKFQSNPTFFSNETQASSFLPNQLTSQFSTKPSLTSPGLGMGLTGHQSNGNNHGAATSFGQLPSMLSRVVNSLQHNHHPTQQHSLNSNQHMQTHHLQSGGLGMSSLTGSNYNSESSSRQISAMSSANHNTPNHPSQITTIFQSMGHSQPHQLIQPQTPLHSLKSPLQPNPPFATPLKYDQPGSSMDIHFVSPPQHQLNSNHKRLNPNIDQNGNSIHQDDYQSQNDRFDSNPTFHPLNDQFSSNTYPIPTLSSKNVPPVSKPPSIARTQPKKSNQPAQSDQSPPIAQQDANLYANTNTAGTKRTRVSQQVQNDPYISLSAQPIQQQSSVSSNNGALNKDSTNANYPRTRDSNSTHMSRTHSTQYAANSRSYSSSDESISTSAEHTIQYAPANGTYLATLPVPDLIERVKAVLVRDNLKQKDLAQYVGISGSTLSPLLKHKYMHTKVQHLQTLIDWVLQRDSEFIKMVNSRIRLLGIDTKQIFHKLSIDEEQWGCWLNLEVTEKNRSLIDNEVTHLIAALSHSRMGGGDEDSPGSFMKENKAGTDASQTGQPALLSSLSAFDDNDNQPNGLDQHFTPNSGADMDVNPIYAHKQMIVQEAFPCLPRNLLRSVVRIIGDLKCKDGNAPLHAMGSTGPAKRGSSGKSSSGGKCGKGGKRTRAPAEFAE